MNVTIERSLKSSHLSLSVRPAPAPLAPCFLPPRLVRPIFSASGVPVSSRGPSVVRPRTPRLWPHLSYTSTLSHASCVAECDGSALSPAVLEEERCKRCFPGPGRYSLEILPLPSQQASGLNLS
eukprot:768520-Hanusia_phi.AAC.12